uniref:PAZ domain-containing protein n=2 Tax=Meloidogyne TaxID=189290 RepID=A0A6V7YC34_MELEN|nr:unnamed protein product [Meloidogyne enterolobii]
MNFNAFNNWAVWGVLPDDDEDEKNSSKQEVEENKSAEKKDAAIIVPEIGGTINIDENLQDKKTEEDIMDDTNEKILEIVLGSDDGDDEDAEHKPLDWLAEMEKKDEDIKEQMNEDKKEPENPFIEPKCVNPEKPLNIPIIKRRSMPLIEYLCQLRKCVLKEMHVLFYNLEIRREIISHLQTNVQLRTSHLPPSRNFIVRCNDFTVQSACNVPAMGGYLGITVRGYYYVKHNFKLRHPYLPCVIEFGGGHHRSYYPLEVLSVTEKNKQMKGH